MAKVMQPFDEVKDEDWYDLGKEVFINKCATCHFQGGNKNKFQKNLFLKALKKYGYDTPDSIVELVRYGKGYMPGFAKDCTEVTQNQRQCGVITPLPDDLIQDVTDFVLNRAYSGWTGRG